MTKEVTETQASFDKDLSDDFLKNMIQETFEDAASPEETNSVDSEQSDTNTDPFDSIGRKIEKVIKKTWHSFLEIPINVNFLNSSLLQYHQIAELSPERSYFSVLAVENPRAVWVHHLNRNLAEGLASLIQARSRKTILGNFSEAVADGSLYLVIGPLVNSTFRNIYEFILKKKIKSKMEVRHLLSPGFHRMVKPEDRYVVMNFFLESHQLAGALQVAIPRAAMLIFLELE